MLEIGTVVEGKVSGLTNFGAFVSLPDGKSGMVHISEVSSSFVKDIHEALEVGQDVKVKVIGIADEGKISLAIKRAAEEARPRPKKGARRGPNVWQGQQRQSNEGLSFEDMMARFKQVSDEKISDLKHGGDSRYGGGSSRRGGRGS